VHYLGRFSSRKRDIRVEETYLEARERGASRKSETVKRARMLRGTEKENEKEMGS
jgi:hypothetical protein